MIIHDLQRLNYQQRQNLECVKQLTKDINMNDYIGQYEEFYKNEYNTIGNLTEVIEEV